MQVLKEMFDAMIIDQDTGRLSLTKPSDRKKIREALRQLGNTDEEIDLDILLEPHW